MRKKITITALVLLALVGVLLYLFLSSKPEPKQGSSFFEVVGYKNTQVADVWAEYYDTTVTLRLQERDRLLTILDHASLRTTIKQEEPYPYQPTEYALSFSVDNKEIPYTFYWFTGKKYGGSGTFEYIDSRFDVMIDGTIYVFDQDSSLREEQTFWNEEISQIAYEAACRSQNVKVPNPAALAGYTGEVRVIMDYTSDPPLYGPYDDPADFISLADCIVLARSQGLQTFRDGYSALNYEVFQVEQVIKEDQKLDPQLPIYIQETVYGPTGLNAFLYPPVDEPFYTEGELYLLCLSDLFPEDDYTLASIITRYSSAHVLNNVCYARYNTEVTPFHLLTIDDVEALCNQ